MNGIHSFIHSFFHEVKNFRSDKAASVLFNVLCLPSSYL